MSLSFLEASRIVKDSSSEKSLQFVLGTSGQTEKLDVFIQAHSLELGFQSKYSTLPFNTFAQYLLTQVKPKKHVFVLFPWDLCPELNWRTGVYSEFKEVDSYLDEANRFLELIDKVEDKHIFYIDTPIPPVMMNEALQEKLRTTLKLHVSLTGAKILGEDYFSLGSYLSNGCPFASSRLSDISYQLTSSLVRNKPPKKVLITDFDHVMWKGVIGEDGPQGIEFEQSGGGYVHYIYQTYLKKLKNAGILLAGVSRNDENLADLPFQSGKMVLKKDDFVTVLASYNAKSSQIISLSESLNLPLDSFVFVDDNPIEIEEVSSRCPELTCITFPAKSEAFSGFIDELSRHFQKTNITEEDSKRTDMYRARAQAVVPSTEKGSDLSGFLSSLDMKVRVKECDNTNSERAVQLINKTNQFNNNGARITETKPQELFDNGVRIITFGLSDKYGDHGEVAVLLLDDDGKLIHFVMSCRVFQRRLEFFALLWLYKELDYNHVDLDFKITEKNLPFQNFLEEYLGVKQNNGVVRIDLKDFYGAYEENLAFFEVENNN